MQTDTQEVDIETAVRGDGTSLAVSIVGCQSSAACMLLPQSMQTNSALPQADLVQPQNKLRKYTTALLFCASKHMHASVTLIILDMQYVYFPGSL